MKSLIHNEIIKVTKKALLWVILLVLLICTASLAYFYSRKDETMGDYDYLQEYANSVNHFKNLIEHEDFHGKEAEYIVVITELELFEILLLNEIPKDGWSYIFLTDIFQLKREMLLENKDADTSALDDLISIAKENDVESYLRIMLENTEDKTTIWYYQYMLDNNMVPDKSDPFFSLLTQLYRLKMDKPENRTEIALLTARLEGKNPDPNEMKGTRAFLLLASNMKYILIISALILGVSVITDDHLKGNIYQYMTFPFTRKKKIFAKYIATMMLLFIVLIFWILITFATAFITWGKGDINLAYIYAFNSHAFTMSFVSYILVLYSAIFLEILIFQFISMLIAVASKSAYISVFTVLAAYFLKANMSIVVKRLIGPNSKMLLFFQNTDVVNGVECMFRNKISSLSLLILFVLGLASFVGAYYIYEEVDW